MAATTTPQTTTTPQATTTIPATTSPSDNSSNTTLIDDVYPTVTIIDNAERDEKKYRRACGCFSERTVVVAIFSMYFFWGIIQIAASLSSLPAVSSTQSRILDVFIAVAALFLVAASAIGLNAMYKQNAKLMRRLSIVFIVLTVMVLSSSVIGFTLDVTSRDDLISQCNQAIQSSDDADTDCTQLVNVFLVKEGLYLLFLAMIELYFAYVIFRHARGMATKSQYPHPLRNGDVLPTYFAYASQGVPTSDNWVPPPTYNGNPNNIPVSGDNKFAEGV